MKIERPKRFPENAGHLLAAELDRDEKTALWLLAWLLRDGWIQRQEAPSSAPSRGTKRRASAVVTATARRRYYLCRRRGRRLR